MKAILVVQTLAIGVLVATLGACNTTGVSDGIDSGNTKTLQSLSPQLLKNSMGAFHGNGASPFQAAKDALDLASRQSGVGSRGRLFAQSVDLMAGDACALPSDSTDADQDGYPASLKYTFDCSKNGATLTGTVEVKDEDDNNPDSGFSLKFSNFKLVATSNNVTSTITFNLETATKNNNNGSFSASEKYNLGLKSGKDSYALDFSSNLSYKPDSDSNSDNFDNGKVNFSTSMSVTENATKESFGITGKDLHLSSTCSSDDLLDAGTLDMTSGKDVLKLEITGCGTGNWTLNGKPTDTAS
jgi:hypothetical protein